MLLKCQNCDSFTGISDRSLSNSDFGMKVGSMTADDMVNNTRYSIALFAIYCFCTGLKLNECLPIANFVMALELSLK